MQYNELRDLCEKLREFGEMDDSINGELAVNLSNICLEYFYRFSIMFQESVLKEIKRMIWDYEENFETEESEEVIEYTKTTTKFKRIKQWDPNERT